MHISFLYLILLAVGCKNVDNQPHLTWYKAPVNSLYNYNNGNYVVGLGILSRSFFLYTDQKNYKQLLKSLENSYKSRKVIEVGYLPDENSKNKIIKIK